MDPFPGPAPGILFRLQSILNIMYPFFFFWGGGGIIAKSIMATPLRVHNNAVHMRRGVHAT